MNDKKTTEQPNHPWPHAPVHKLSEAGAYILTGSTLYKEQNYVHKNAVKHGLVSEANQYSWCSARWFERTATRAQVKTIYSFKYDQVNERDDYEPLLPPDFNLE